MLTAARIRRIALVGGLLVSAGATRGAETLGALSAGLACGAALGYLGLRHTRFEVTPEGRFYTPHTYIGLAVTLLFLGRLAYRAVSLSNGTNGMPGGDSTLAAASQGPLTLGVFAVLLGYYLVFYSGVLLWSRAAPAAADPLAPE